METAISVIHLTEFGHVLGVFASGSTEPTIEDLTGAEGLGVRDTASSSSSNEVLIVPDNLLSVTRTEYKDSVINSPWNYRLIDDPSSLVLSPDPDQFPTFANATDTSGDIIGSPGETWLLLTGVGDDTEVLQPVLTASGRLPAPPTLPGETAKLLVGPTSGLFFG